MKQFPLNATLNNPGRVMKFKKVKKHLEVIALRGALQFPISQRRKYKFTRSLNKRYAEIAEMDHNVRSRGIWHNPLISIIVVSHNSGDDLPECFRSIQEQTYKNCEVLLVENGREKNESLFKRFFKDGIYIATANMGFADANNIGQKFATGEYILLLNPDAKLEEDCIERLLESFLEGEDTAVAVPKIRFWTRFFNIKLYSQSPISLSREALDVQLDYKKIFLIQGRQDQDIISALHDGVQYVIELNIPIQKSDIDLQVTCEGSIAVHLEGEGKRDYLNSVDRIYNIVIKRRSINRTFWVINNAGSDFSDGMPYDRAFGERDRGQHDGFFDVKALCGCAALIKRSALEGREIFNRNFFAYYEDSELSYWLGSKGKGIKYNAKALCYHKHSTASQEYSPTWHALVNRSAQIYKYYAGHIGAQESLKQFLSNTNRYSSINPELAETLTCLDNDIFAKSPKRTLIGLYNSYWNTYGGGEVHALQLLGKIVTPEDEVHLICEEDFDLDKVIAFSGYQGPRPIKVIERGFSTAFTKKYDLFVNSTYGSNLKSAAKTSAYIVSFPHKKFSHESLSSYDFVFYNSEFTKDAAATIWPNINGDVIYPTLSNNISNFREESNSKENIILSIGRFTRGGHAKNQDKILQAFVATSHEHDFKLALIGSAGKSEDDILYLQELENEARKMPERIFVLKNAPPSMVENYLQKSKIYIHATGLDQKPSDLALHEHFGMAVLEAASYGIYPIVYHIGGPAEVVKSLKFGSTYKDIEEMMSEIREISSRDMIEHGTIMLNAKKFVDENETNLLKIVAELRVTCFNNSSC